MTRENLTYYGMNKFPILPLLVSKKNEDIVVAYFRYLFFTQEIANTINKNSIAKLQEISQIEDVFFHRSEEKQNKFDYALVLRDEFEKNLIAPILFIDTISSFKKDASSYTYENWEMLLEYAKNSTGSIARFLLSLNDESPTTYIPAESLSVALNLLYNIKDMKYNAEFLKRVHIPNNVMFEHLIKPIYLYNNEMSPDLKLIVKDALNRIRGLLKDAEILPSIIKSTRVRIQFCIIIATAHQLLRKISYTDVLKKKVEINIFDRINIIITGVVEGICTSYKSLSIKKVKR